VLRSGDGDGHVDIAARGVGIGAHFVGLVDEGFSLGVVEAGNSALEFDRDVVTLAAFVGVFAKGHGRVDAGVIRHGDFFAAGNRLYGAEEAGGVAGGEKLLRIGAWAIIAAHCLGGVEFV